MYFCFFYFENTYCGSKFDPKVSSSNSVGQKSYVDGTLSVHFFVLIRFSEHKEKLPKIELKTVKFAQNKIFT